MAEDKRRVQVSKALSWILRHGATKEGLAMSENGWIKLEDILRKPKFNGVSVDYIKNIVSVCSKQRFALKEEEGELYIRANQGHTLDNINPDLVEIQDASEIPTVVHGTYSKHWPLIRASGLSKMARQHIHFATGLPDNSAVISGMRTSCDTQIYVNALRAMRDGFKFYRSINGVILCPGDEEGFLPVKYFDRVIDVKTKTNILND